MLDCLPALHVECIDTPQEWISTPTGCHETCEGLWTVLRNGRPVSLIHHHEEDLTYCQALEQTGPSVHLPHCNTSNVHLPHCNTSNVHLPHCNTSSLHLPHCNTQSVHCQACQNKTDAMQATFVQQAWHGQSKSMRAIALQLMQHGCDPCIKCG